MPDGAQSALLGYLYQFTQVAALTARGLVTSDDGWQLLDGLVAEGEVTSELFNQDAVISAPGQTPVCAAIQLKHTGDAAKRIGLQDFLELLHGFEQSRKLAERAGSAIVRYFVITNRACSEDVEAIWVAQSEQGLTQAVRKKVIAKSCPKWLRTMLNAYQGGEDSAVKAWSGVLAQLAPLLPASHQRGLNQLRQFGRRHGLSEVEIDSGLSKFHGKLLIETANSGSVSLSTDWLKRHNLGASGLREATLGVHNGITHAAQILVRERLKRVAGPSSASLTRRRLLNDLHNQISRFAVTFVCGGGGCGKSTLALQCLLDIQGYPVIMSFDRGSATIDNLCRALRALRCAGGSHELSDESFGHTLDRLRRANVGAPVVLIVDVDAIDEAEPRLHGDIRRLFALPDGMGEQRDVRLLVSCRSGTDRRAVLANLVAKWFDTEYPEQFVGQVGFVHVGDFDDSEFGDAVRRLGQDFADLFSSTPDTLTTDSTAITSPGQFATGYDPLARSGISRSLRHPVVWGAFVESEADERRAILEGDLATTGRLADRLVGRFFRKCCDRQGGHLVPEHLQSALASVATATATAELPHSREQDWGHPCVGFVDAVTSAMLYSEALSYGLIQEDQPGQWRWRHEFLADYLARGAT